MTRFPLLLLLAAAAPAQTLPAPSLRGAWLKELLDLDPAGAAADYAAVHRDPRAPATERWLGAARLLELERLGVASAAGVVDESAAPPALREAFARVRSTPPQFEPLLAAARQGLEALNEHLRQVDRAAPRPQTRPLLADAQRWALDQSGPGNRERRRQLVAQLQLARRSGDAALYLDARRQLRNLEPEGQRFRSALRPLALQILKHELAGDAEGASRLRSQWFPDWRPPAAGDPPGAALARALAALPALASGEEVPAEEAAALKQLGERLQHAAAAGPEAGLALLQRLPFYGERLLREGGR